MSKCKFETDCEIPFKIHYLFRRGSCKSCGITLENGRKLSYLPIPCEVRYATASFARYLKSEEGQQEIKNELARITR